MVHSHINQSLMQAFDFTADDLAANQAHMLTPAQSQRVAQSERLARRGGSCALIALGLPVVAISAILAWVRFTFPPQSAPPWPLFGGILGFLGLILAFVIVSNRKTINRLTNPRLQVRSGVARLEKKALKNKGWSMYFLTIDGVRFQLPTAEQFQALQDGQRYHVRYIEMPPVHLIMSVEPA